MRNLVDNPLLLIVLLLIIVLVFGSRRLPDAARSVARSMKIFRTEMKDFREADTPASPAHLEARTAVDPPTVAEVRSPELRPADDLHQRR